LKLNVNYTTLIGASNLQHEKCVQHFRLGFWRPLWPHASHVPETGVTPALSHLRSGVLDLGNLRCWLRRGRQTQQLLSCILM